MTNKSRAEEMTQLLEAQASSGMSKKAFCEDRGLAPSMFYYWQRRLSEESAMPEQEPGFTQLEVQPDQIGIGGSMGRFFVSFGGVMNKALKSADSGITALKNFARGLK